MNTINETCTLKPYYLSKLENITKQPYYIIDQEF